MSILRTLLSIALRRNFASPIMSLDLKLEDSFDDLCKEMLPILRDFLQPDTAVLLETTANKILDLLPDKSPNSNDVWVFGEICIELAEQIPYHHPSQLKLAGLLELLGKSTKIGRICVLEVEVPQAFRDSDVDHY